MLVTVVRASLTMVARAPVTVETWASIESRLSDFVLVAWAVVVGYVRTSPSRGLLRGRWTP